MKKLAPHWQILTALVAATVLASIFRVVVSYSPDGGWGTELIEQVIAVSGFVGTLFIQALKMIIVPLVMSAIISGIAGLGGVEGFGRLGLKTVGFYMSTSFLAIMVGLLFVNTIQPGLSDGKPNVEIRTALLSQADGASVQEKEKVAAAGERKAGGFVGLFKKMIPPNVIKAASDNGQLLGLIFFSILFAIAMTRLPSNTMSPLLGAIQAMNDVMILITQWIMALAPIGVFGLMVPTIYHSGIQIFSVLGLYFLTVALALASEPA